MSSINAAIGANRRTGFPLKLANAIPVSNKSASAEIVSHAGNDFGTLGAPGLNCLTHHDTQRLAPEGKVVQRIVNASWIRRRLLSAD